MSQKTQYRLIAKVSYRLVIRQSTPLNSEIICVQNVGTKVVCGNFFVQLKANSAEKMKKIMGAV